MKYGVLFKKKDKSKLRNSLVSKVNEDLADHDICDAVRNKIPEFVDVHLTKGVPEYMIVEFLDGKRVDEFCAECQDSPCCTQNDPIALALGDVKRIAKGLGKSSKYVIKHYLAHYNPVEVPHICYKMKRAKPCQWMDGKFRCTIYEFRPTVCRVYPLSLNTNGSTTAMIAGVSSYCNVAFNMMKRGVKRMALREDFRMKHPQECAIIEATACMGLPSRKELSAMEQTDRARLLQKANDAFYDGILRWQKEG